MTGRDDRPVNVPRRVAAVTPDLCAVLVLWALIAYALYPPPRNPAAVPGVLGMHPSLIRALAFSPDGATLAVGGLGGSVGLWDVGSKRGALVVPPQESPTYGLAFKPDLSALAAVGPQAEVTVRDLTTGRGHFSFAIGDPENRCVAYAPDGSALAVGRRDGSIALVSAAGRQEAVLSGISDGIRAIAFAPGGRFLAACDVTGAVAVWDVARRQRAASFPTSGRGPACFAFAPRGAAIAVSTGSPVSTRLYDLRSGRGTPVGHGIGPSCTAMAFAPDGRTLAMAHGDGSVVLWDTATDRRLADFRGFRGLVWALAFSPDGRRLASGGDDLTVRLWDVPAVSGG